MLKPLRVPPTPPHAGGAADRRRPRWRLSGITAAALLLALAGGGWAAEAATLRLRCSNPVSGASWQIAVDLDRGLVDSIGATITDKWIRWHDPKQGFFELERATGKLQFRNASSTGGYFLFFTCRPE